mgnify:CR=1 FL=1
MALATTIKKKFEPVWIFWRKIQTVILEVCTQKINTQSDTQNLKKECSKSVKWRALKRDIFWDIKEDLIKTHKMGTKYTNHLVKMEYGYVKITILPKYDNKILDINYESNDLFDLRIWKMQRGTYFSITPK